MIRLLPPRIVMIEKSSLITFHSSLLTSNILFRSQKEYNRDIVVLPTGPGGRHGWHSPAVLVLSPVCWASRCFWVGGVLRGFARARQGCRPPGLPILLLERRESLR